MEKDKAKDTRSPELILIDVCEKIYASGRALCNNEELSEIVQKGLAATATEDHKLIIDLALITASYVGTKRGLRQSMRMAEFVRDSGKIF